jgi:hypothetical protein
MQTLNVPSNAAILLGIDTIHAVEPPKPARRKPMTNAQATSRFLASIDAKTKAAILENIATNYGITQAEALAEVTDNDAEHLLDYVTGPERAATSVLMQRHA